MRDFTQPEKLRNTVFRVDHVIPGLHVDQVRRKSGQRGFRGRRAGNQFGGLEKILRSEYYKMGIYESGTMANQPLDQEDAGYGPSHVSPLRQVCGSGAGLFDPEPVGQAILVENIRDAFYFTCRRGEEGHAIARFHQIARLGYGDLHVAMKRHGGAGRDVERGICTKRSQF